MNADPLARGPVVDVCSLPEAALIGDRYAAILTVGPDLWEVSYFEHPNHRVFSFEDVEHRGHPEAPTLALVESAVAWGAGERGDLLVHCHMGISRSTATAWGVLISRGADPEVSLRDLMNRHPRERDGSRRPFAPNRLIVAHLETAFDLPGLLELRDRLCVRI